MFSMIDFSGLAGLFFQPFTCETLFFLGLLGLASNCSCGSHHEEDEQDETIYIELERRIGELKTKIEQGEVSLKRELADTILALAVQLQQDGFGDD